MKTASTQNNRSRPISIRQVALGLALIFRLAHSLVLQMRCFLTFLAVLSLNWTSLVKGNEAMSVEVVQITREPHTHFFGYIGHVQNIPWNKSGRFIVALQSDFHDRMPGPNDPARVVLIDTENDYHVTVVDQSRGWNPQQGTMFYWNPANPETQFFFNDRDVKTGKVFCVLYDIKLDKRVREYRFDDTPIGNGGVAQNGGWFLGLNYARMARLRPVTGYKGTWDWTEGEAHPKNDGLFRVDIQTGKKQLLVSFHQMANELTAIGRDVKNSHLFINHSLPNREGDRIFFFARAGWSGQKGQKINHPFITNDKGENLRSNRIHIGGHPEWDYGHRMIGRLGDRQILFDTDQQLIAGTLGTPEIFPNPEGDIALSPNGKLFINGHKDRKNKKNFYTIYRREDRAYFRTKGFNIAHWQSGDLRQDPSPCWNRNSDQILVPGVSKNGKTRQLFILKLKQ